MIHVTHLLDSTDISIFLPKINNFCYIKKYRYRFHLDAYFLILLTFLESLMIVLINKVKILMMSAKMATRGVLKIKFFGKKDYDVITSVHEFNNKIPSRDSNYNVNVVMWPKFGNSSISVREVIITSILLGFDQENRLFWRVVLFQVQQFGTDTRYELEILH